MRDTAIYGIGVITLGLVCAAFMGFALQWQPTPEPFVSMKPLAMLSAASLLICGGLIMLPRTSRWGGLACAILFGLWVALLHAPRIFAEPASLVAWLGGAEIGALAQAAVVWAIGRTPGQQAWVRIAMALYGVCAIVFGISHFYYADFTAAMVPAWLPGRLPLAYLTGLFHCAAGLALISGVLARQAAGLLALMCMSFAVLVHIPGVIAEPTSQLAWTALAISILISGSAWLVRTGAGPIFPEVPVSNSQTVRNAETQG